MFKLVKKLSIWWPVTVQVPQDGGKTQPRKLQAEFKLLTQPQIDELLQESPLDVDFLCEAVTDWKEVESEDGEPLICSPEQRRELFEIGYVRAGFFEAFWKANAGRAAALKN